MSTSDERTKEREMALEALSAKACALEDAEAYLKDAKRETDRCSSALGKAKEEYTKALSHVHAVFLFPEMPKPARGFAAPED